MLLLVLRLRHVLVALHQLGPCARPVERILTRVLGADRALGEQALQVLGVTRGARRRISSAYELLELMPASAAFVLVNRHGNTVVFLRRRAQGFRAAASKLLLRATLAITSG